MGQNDYNAAIMALSPIAYWKLNETEGTATCTDSSGYGYNGTYTTSSALGAAGLIYAETQTSMSCSGNDWVTLPTGTGLSANSKSFTCCFWMKRGATSTWEEMVTTWAHELNAGWEVRIESSTSTALFYLSKSGAPGSDRQVVSASAIDDNVTHFIVAMYDRPNATINIKVDNGAYATDGSAAQVTTWDADPFLAKRTEGLPYAGVLEKVALFDKVISETNLGNLYTYGTTADAPPKSPLPCFIPSII